MSAQPGLSPPLIAMAVPMGTSPQELQRMLEKYGPVKSLRCVRDGTQDTKRAYFT